MSKKFVMMILRMSIVIIGCFAINIGECLTLNTKTKETSYLDWKPILKAKDVFKNVVTFMYLKTDDKGNLFWVEQRPGEEGRSVLVQRDANGIIKDITPKTYSVRTRVYEYGGSPYTVKGHWVYFVNFQDQRIYRQNLQDLADIIPLTPELNADGSLGKYMDLSVSPDGHWLLFVYEKEIKQGEHPNFLALLNLKDSHLQEPKILVQDANFYKTPKFSPDGTQLAWLEWNHPYMPWDSTQLYLVQFKNGEAVEKSQVHIAGADDSSISSIIFLPNGNLYYAQDFAGKKENNPENYYNIFCYTNGNKTIVTKELSDFQFITAAGNDLLVTLEHHGEPKLLLLNPENGKSKQLAAQYSDLLFPVGNSAGEIYVAGYSSSKPCQLLKITPKHEVTSLRNSTDYKIDVHAVSQPTLIEFPTADGQNSYGYFYPPLNPNYKSLANEKPPVRVLVHGGPVSRTSRIFTLPKQFWTSQGIAIFDVNYRGSTGFGRFYRDALKKKWGLIEIQDVKDGLAELTRRGLINDQAVVSGGSAGGYTVDRLLTYYPDLFVAGASYYGVANLVMLQKSTHKFESHYLEQLIGGTLETNLKEYNERSPINHLDKLKAPMIIFQGSDDKVVPPENSREIARLLDKKGIYHEYYEYSGEAHGFRKKENLTDSLEKESHFFKKILQG